MEYGPHLLALPPPAWWARYRPTLPPYSVVVTRLSDSKEIEFSEFLEQREALSYLRGIRLDADHVAEVFDAAGDEWIARMHVKSTDTGSVT